MKNADPHLVSPLHHSSRAARTPASSHLEELIARLDVAALQTASDAAIALDGDLRIISWNAAAQRLYQLAASDVLGRRFDEIVSCAAEASARGLAGFPMLNAIGLINGRAMHVVRRGGGAGEGWRGGAGGAGGVVVSVTAIPMRLPDGEDRFLVLVRDEAQHVRLERSLDERLKVEMLLADMSTRFAAAPEDQIDGQIELWLRRLVEILDLDRGTFAELCPDGQLEVTHSYAARGIEPYPRGVANVRMPWMTGEFAAGRTVMFSNVPDDFPAEAVAERRYFVEAGILAGIGIPISVAGQLVCVLTFGMFRRSRTWPVELIARLHLAGDIFANAIVRRHCKLQLEQKQHELTHVTRVAHVGELAAVIAHELDQPLTAIVSNAEAVRYMLQSGEGGSVAGGADASEVDEALKDVVDSAMRASEIVRRERRLLRKSHVSFEAVDLNESVREVELFIRAEVRQAGARATLELVPGLPMVMGDRVQLQQVILNMACNAIQAMRDQPGETRELSIRTAAVSGEVILSVSDAGPPTDPLQMKRMFEPFYTTKPGGLGMGLSISKSILDAHHGRIWAVPNPGRGISVHIAIPRRK